MDTRSSKLRFGKQMLILSRNAKSGWRRQWMNSEIGWIAYAHICLATCIPYARLDLAYLLMFFLAGDYGCCSSKISLP